MENNDKLFYSHLIKLSWKPFCNCDEKILDTKDLFCPQCQKPLGLYKKNNFVKTVCYHCWKEFSPVLKKNKHKRTNSSHQRWAKSIKILFEFKCFNCGKTENLESHHIIPVSMNKRLSTNLKNGICLCHDCHKKLHEL